MHEENDKLAPRWDKRETEHLLLRQWGSQCKWNLSPVLRAVTTRLAHAQYHFAECERLVAEHVDQRLKQGDCIYTITSPDSESEISSHHQFFVACEAHMLACAQAIHATADNLAHLVYYALGLDRGDHSLEERKIGLHTVLQVLDKHGTTSSDFSHVQTPLKKLKECASFKDLDAVVNQIKHRGGPYATLAIEPSDANSYEIRFSDFFRERYRPPKEIEELLGPAFEIVSETVENTGLALNGVLSNWVKDH